MMIFFYVFKFYVFINSGNPVSDFELMMMRKKEEQSMKRRRKDIDIINDNDDIIAGLIGDMKHAAEVIRYLIESKYYT